MPSGDSCVSETFRISVHRVESNLHRPEYQLYFHLHTDVPLIPERALRCAQACSPFHRACYMFCFGFSPLRACFQPRIASWSSPLTPNFNPTRKTELQCHLLPETFPEPSSQEGLFCLWFLSNIICFFYIILNHQFFKKNFIMDIFFKAQF